MEVSPRQKPAVWWPCPRTGTWILPLDCFCQSNASQSPPPKSLLRAWSLHNQTDILKPRKHQFPTFSAHWTRSSRGKERGLHKDQGCLAHALDLTGELDPTPGLFPFILFSGLSAVWATLVCYRSVPKAYYYRLWFIFHLSHTVNHKLISSFKRKRWRLQVCSFAELGGSSEMK